MKLEQQVCNLGLAKQLKELGVKQNSVLYWAVPKKTLDVTPSLEYATVAASWLDGLVEQISAFTVAELGEMLPLDVNIPLKNRRKRKGSHRITYAHWEAGWKCGLNHATAQFYMNIVESTEADARAKMLVYLLQNKLIQLPQ